MRLYTKKIMQQRMIKIICFLICSRKYYFLKLKNIHQTLERLLPISTWAGKNIFYPKTPLPSHTESYKYFKYNNNDLLCTEDNMSFRKRRVNRKFFKLLIETHNIFKDRLV